MATLSNASRACLRSAAKQPSAIATRALSSTAMRPDSAAGWTSYSSPFKGTEQKGSKIPDFGKYVSSSSPTTNKVFQYFMVGSMGAITAAGAKSTVQGLFCPTLGISSPACH
jgi:ubiquinol-cytochrome c reductase iron-sulfur subunit